MTLKNPKRLTRSHKELLSKNGLNWKEYSFVEEWETKVIFYHKPTGALKPVDKKRR